MVYRNLALVRRDQRSLECSGPRRWPGAVPRSPGPPRAGLLPPQPRPALPRQTRVRGRNGIVRPGATDLQGPGGSPRGGLRPPRQGIHPAEEGRHKEALARLADCLARFTQMGDRAGEAFTRFNRGLIYQAQGEFQRALEELDLLPRAFRGQGQRLLWDSPGHCGAAARRWPPSAIRPPRPGGGEHLWRSLSSSMHKRRRRSNTARWLVDKEVRMRKTLAVLVLSSARSCSSPPPLGHTTCTGSPRSRRSAPPRRA